MNLPERIRKVIKDSELTLPEVAKRMGVGKNTIVRYRDGTTSPTVEFLEKMADEFSVSRKWLFLGEEPMRRGSIEASEEDNLQLIKECIEGIYKLMLQRRAPELLHLAPKLSKHVLEFYRNYVKQHPLVRHETLKSTLDFLDSGDIEAFLQELPEEPKRDD